jgi:gas vesicle protein
LQHRRLYATTSFMLRLRFGSGVILGLVLGIPAGALIALLLAPAPPPTDRTATALQVQELTRRLEAAKEDRQRADKQIEQFQKLAEQMTTTFNNLEQRFTALQEAQRAQEARAAQAPPPTAPAAATPTPPATPEQAAAAANPPAPPPAAGDAPPGEAAR